MSSSLPSSTTLVLGATGGTGRHLVQQLLDQGHRVKVIVRSRQRMMDALSNPPQDASQLVVTEASFLDLSDEDIRQQVQDVDAVVSCLGHNLTFKGIFLDSNLVTQAVQRFTQAMIACAQDSNKTPKKFVLMGSDGVAHPAGTDDVRPFSERLILSLVRCLVSPHRDNEAATDFLYHTLGANAETCPALEWTVVRPTDLIDEPASEYTLYTKPLGSLFGGGVTSRANVALFMTHLVTQKDLWNTWKYQLPVVHDKTVATPSGGESKKQS